MAESAETFGWISLLPPLLAIVLAMWTRRVILALFFGLWLGVTMLHRWNPLTGLRALIEEFAFEQVSDPWNASVLVLMLCIGGFVRLIVRSGAAEAFATALARVVTNPARAHLAVWCSGIAIFFSDSANPLILGPLFAPLFDRLRLSREKLAYLIDSTAAPICILVPITSWAAFVLSLLARESGDLPVEETPLAIYLHSIPFQFYALGSLFLVPWIGLMGLDYGPMRRAKARSVATTALAGPSSPRERNETNPIPLRRAKVGAAALGTLAIVILVVFLGSGGFPDVAVLDALARGKSITAVTSGFVAAALMLGGLLLAERAMTLRELITHWIRGAASMSGVLLILTLAWSLGACCDALGTGAYVGAVVESTVSPLLVPALVFLVGAIVSFATGSAWGCYAILMPISIPLALQMGVPIHLVLAAVLSGGIFGDHASPISDTTILSSMGAGCEHVEHVRTQLPYALTAGVAALAGFVLAPVWNSAWALLPVLGLLVALPLLFHRLTRSSLSEV